MDRFDYWSSAYEPIAQQQRKRFRLVYSDEAYRIFPRYNVDAAVLRAIETLDPDNLPPFDALKQHLADATQTAASDFTEPNDNAVRNTAMKDEREWLRDRLSQLNPLDVEGQQPLFYRRVLNGTEVAALRTRLNDNWGVEAGYWYPLVEKTHPTLVAYNLSDLDEPALQNSIRHFLRQKSEGRIWEIREFGSGYEIDAGSEELFYNGEEGFWTDNGGEWVAYCSHENTITFGGTLAQHVIVQMPLQALHS